MSELEQRIRTMIRDNMQRGEQQDAIADLVVREFGIAPLIADQLVQEEFTADALNL